MTTPRTPKARRRSRSRQRRTRPNRCKNTMDVSSYYSKKVLWTIIDPYLVNTLAFIIIFLPILLIGIIVFPFYVLSCKTIINSYTFCLKQHRLIIISNYRLKGIRGVLVDSALLYAFQSFSIIFLALDTLIFPEISSVEIKSPIFITGCPRSGTTFSHRILTTPPPEHRVSSNIIEDSPFVIHALWEILFPSLTIKCMIYHIVAWMDVILDKFGTNNQLEGAYDLKLNSEAAEEGLIGMHIMAGDFWSEFLAVGFFFCDISRYLGMVHAFDPLIGCFQCSYCFGAGIGVKEHWKQHHIVLLRALLQRQIYWSGKTQVVAKSPSLSWFLDDVISEFPDCKILLMVRDPYDMIRSTVMRNNCMDISSVSIRSDL